MEFSFEISFGSSFEISFDYEWDAWLWDDLDCKWLENVREDDREDDMSGCAWLWADLKICLGCVCHGIGKKMDRELGIELGIDSGMGKKDECEK